MGWVRRLAMWGGRLGGWLGGWMGEEAGNVGR